MLPGGVGPPFKGTLIGITSIALEKKFQVLTPALPAGCTGISCQFKPPLKLELMHYEKINRLLLYSSPLGRFATIMG
jgi:hypothetical protein